MSVTIRSKLDSIQMLRGLAAFCVLIYHATQQQMHAIGAIGVKAPAPTIDLWLLFGPWSQGYAGVDLFFVISGFIMVYVTQNSGRKAADVGAFLYKRIVRIYPLWWGAASIMGGYYFISSGLWAAPKLGFSASESIAYFIKSLALIPQDKMPVLGDGWTLVHEMQFYLIFAFLLFFPRRFLPALLVGWAVFNLGGYFIGLRTFGPVMSILFSPFSLEFIIGAAVALLIIKRIYIAPKIILALGTLILSAVIVLNMGGVTAMLPINRILFYGLPFAAIIYGLSILEQQGGLRVPRGFVRLGDWSYSLYLSHYIVLIIIRRVGREAAPYLPEGLVSTFSLGTPGLADNIAYMLTAITLAIIVAALCFYIIERPLLRLARRHK